MDDPAFSPGFRFSVLDGIVLAIGAVATIGVVMIDLWIGIAIAFVVLHFFFFCNILRMSRTLELIWAAIFAVSAVLATVVVVAWPVAFGVSLLATLLVAVVELRRPSYHGVAWARVNPRLPEWWKAQNSVG